MVVTEKYKLYLGRRERAKKNGRRKREREKGRRDWRRKGRVFITFDGPEKPKKLKLKK